MIVNNIERPFNACLKTLETCPLLKLFGWLNRPDYNGTTGSQVGQGDPGRQVLTQLLRVDLIQGVIGRMVQIEIPAGILVQVNDRHS